MSISDEDVIDLTIFSACDENVHKEEDANHPRKRRRVMKASAVRQRERSATNVKQNRQLRAARALCNVVRAQPEPPNFSDLFVQFDELLFDGLLTRHACTVAWSKRMTLCAGMCYQYKNGSSRRCEIRLSEKLLQYRTNADALDTLLHECIHAVLFIRRIAAGRDGHGEPFLQLMRRINEACDTNITVYHSFHDEVDHLRQHIWRCDGSCRTRAPYFGLVKRVMNRPPQPADSWFSRHQRECGGTFHKISSPSKKTAAKARKNDSKPIKSNTTLDQFVRPKKASKSSADSGSSVSVPKDQSASRPFKEPRPRLPDPKELRQKRLAALRRLGL
ncbi:MAG: hypothetical protein MHM6MM_008501 [Cercozoa sp. M6MM]